MDTAAKDQLKTDTHEKELATGMKWIEVKHTTTKHKMYDTPSPFIRSESQYRGAKQKEQMRRNIYSKRNKIKERLSKSSYLRTQLQK